MYLQGGSSLKLKSRIHLKKKKATFVRTWKWNEQNVPKAWNEAMFSSLKLRLLRWINTKCCSYPKETKQNKKIEKYILQGALF